MYKKDILQKIALREFAPGIPYHKGTSEIPKKENKTFEYVIQKHIADRAGKHYDVRLGDTETGIGHSFVVRTLPKKGEKILAHHTVDHVIPYFDFKGRIEKGYGKGVVRHVERGKATIKSSSPDKITFLTHTSHPKKYSLIHTGGKKWLMIQSDLEKKADFSREEADQRLKLIMKDLKPNAYKIDVVGSYSRGHDKVSDLDIVMYPKPSFKDLNSFINPKDRKFVKFDADGMPVNLWLTDKKSYEPTKMHFALGKHIIRLKGEAKKRGMKLTRYGLQDKDQLHTKEKDIRKRLQ